jgi:Raf kinase inhibitor-like YbhB/YbcL family protein
MKKLTTIAAVAVLALASQTSFAKDSFKLSSSDIKAGSRIDMKHVFKGFGCEGGNVSPALSWSGAPAGTKSIALMVHDANAPTGGAGWWHWVAYNIPAEAKGLDQGAGTADGAKLPKGSAQANTDFGAPGWGGPCPPEGHGVHKYVFTVYAIKTDKLDIPAGATASLAGYMINGNSLASAKLLGTYSRPKGK